MRVLIIILLTCACILSITGHAQVNYVLNGGFEQYSSCPTGYDQIKKANYWQPIDSNNTDPVCSSEYCNVCADYASGVSLPNNYYFLHNARSGNGLAISEVYYDNIIASLSYQRDYTQGKLYNHLTAGKSYCVSFYVLLIRRSQYAINKIGAYLDNGAINAGQDSAGCAQPQTTFMPQVYATAIINDTTNWVKVQGSFTANGTERFITIGNFFSNNNTDTIKLQPPTITHYSWYLIDDVSVIASDAVANAGPDGMIAAGDTGHIGTYEEGMPCEWYVLGGTAPIGYGGGIMVHPTATTTYVVKLDLCGHVTYDTMKLYVYPAGVSGLSLNSSLVTVYPNPATTLLHIDHAAACAMQVYDMTGRAVLQRSLVADKEIVDISMLANGMYMVQLSDGDGNKVMKQIVVSGKL